MIDGDVTFGPINPGQAIQSADTFTVRVDRAIPVQNSNLNWRVTYAYDTGGLFTTTATLPLK